MLYNSFNKMKSNFSSDFDFFFYDHVIWYQSKKVDPSSFIFTNKIPNSRL